MQGEKSVLPRFQLEEARRKLKLRYANEHLGCQASWELLPLKTGNLLSAQLVQKEECFLPAPTPDNQSQEHKVFVENELSHIDKYWLNKNNSGVGWGGGPFFPKKGERELPFLKEISFICPPFFHTALIKVWRAPLKYAPHVPEEECGSPYKESLSPL